MNRPVKVPLENRLSYRCSIVATRITRFLAPMLEEEYGLSVINWRVMAVIGRYAPLAAKDVVVHTSTDPYFVYRAVEQLVARALVRRDVDQRDRRRICLELTDTGADIHRRVESTLNRIEAALLARYTERQRQALQDALSMLEHESLALTQSGRSWRDFV